MSKFTVTSLIFTLLVLEVKSTKMKKDFDQILTECAPKYGVTKQYVYEDNTVSDPCFYQCLLEGLGFMDDAGNFDLDKMLAHLEDSKPEEEEEYKTCESDHSDNPCEVAKCVCDVNEKYNE